MIATLIPVPSRPSSFCATSAPVIAIAWMSSGSLTFSNGASATVSTEWTETTPSSPRII
jgi:hypothetical protein